MLTHVLHANWSAGALHLWAESVEVAAPVLARKPGEVPAAVVAHPFVSGTVELRSLLAAVSSGLQSARLGTNPAAPTQPLALADGELTMRLPAHGELPLPSPSIAHATGHTVSEDGTSLPVFAAFTVPTLQIEAPDVIPVLEALDGAFGESALDLNPHAPVNLGASAAFFASAARFARWLLVQQRFVPAIVQELTGGVRGLWQPWLADDAIAQRAGKLLAGMPPAARAVVDAAGHEPWPMIEDFLVRTCDAECRRVMSVENMVETIEGRRNAQGFSPDPHVTWLGGLLAPEHAVHVVGEKRTDLIKRIRGWIGALDRRGIAAAWKLCLKITEPIDVSGLGDFAAPSAKTLWPLTLHLQAVESSTTIIDASDIWLLPTDGALVGGKRIDKPQELLLAELGRAARLYRPLEEALKQSEPSELGLTTVQAYEFLREFRTILSEQGFGVIVPEWWDSPASRLGVRLRIDTPDAPAEAGVSPVVTPRVGLGTLVSYQWQISIGQTVLSLQDFEKLATMRTPLVMIGGRWVEVRPEDIQAAVEFIRENPGGEMELGKAMRLAYAADLRQTGVPVVGMDASGWLSALLSNAGLSGNVPGTMQMLQPPAGFVGELRPYQLKGLSWLNFLDQIGLGACLADDMGLGKTIQLIAMLLRERETAPPGERIGPTLLIVPMSVVGNWVRECHRFAPSLKVLVHHGGTRHMGEELVRGAMDSDLVVTTYALAHRDREELERITWHRISLDEAQNIKNPGTKQTQAIRSLDAPRRVALTGTPIENRLSELWSIMDFLNPGLLGGVHEFRTRFALPIERYHDPAKSKQLRAMVQPFVLRRLKTDSTVIADLPEKVETKEFCYLTPEQATLYEQTVKHMLASAEAAEGIQRRGIVLAGLVKLKQVCNHPLQFLKEHDPESPSVGGVASAGRSGKCVRIVQMLDEVVASGGQALVFTQFRQMGSILAAMLRHELNREVLFLHGGSTAKERDAMVQQFQKADGSAPVFILSLKAGGVGLNLTGANHVFHFDRWWNPAVENQATDRAYRIGQTRTVQVHKFVVSGTLEERIDQMIEQKTALADNVIGSGENWLTELSLTQLREVLELRPEAVEDDAEVVA